MKTAVSKERREARRKLAAYLKDSRQQYDDLHGSLKKYRNQLKQQVERKLSEQGLTAEVEGRVKKWAQIEPKLSEGKKLLQVNDLVGVRVGYQQVLSVGRGGGKGHRADRECVEQFGLYVVLPGR